MSQSAHGGQRPGAGRKPKYGSARATVVKRVPQALVGAIDALIAAQPPQRLPDEAMRVAEAANEAAIPVALNKVPAGFPSPAEPYIADYLDFNQYLISNPAATFAVRAGGVSMLDAGIDVNDLLVIDRAKTPKHKDIVMADMGNEFTIKRLHQRPGLVELQAENEAEAYPVFRPGPEDVWHIVGVVTFVIKDVRHGKR
ncbi:MAG: translesion error-prone DNA polymerase V autoproteolytic subunit [Neisseriaceae bacterium]|nr:translesion error-prone DNA polymerase V autoproteolytic subunit [Neisseriaceae bacterium]MBP6861660.1 translesion error-prone DNA polymerase V autoproteolytic subunit [Neisseriaceae bacterium]